MDPVGRMPAWMNRWTNPQPCPNPKALGPCF
jgi:hypothetical protein